MALFFFLWGGGGSTILRPGEIPFHLMNSRSKKEGVAAFFFLLIFRFDKKMTAVIIATQSVQVCFEVWLHIILSLGTYYIVIFHFQRSW